MPDDSQMHPATAAIHGGAPTTGGAVTPIHPASVYRLPDYDVMSRVFTEPLDISSYARFGDPTLTAAEAKLAALERTETSLLFSSGMAAITTVALALLKPGDELITARDIYGTTHTFFHRYLAERHGVTITTVDATRPDEIRAAVSDRTRLIYVETPTNPLLKLVDLAAVGAIGRELNVPTAVDGTFASPINLPAAALGIDYSIHSATKYLGGHSDLLAGGVSGTKARLAPIRSLRLLLGNLPSAHTSFLLDRGMKTVAVRVARQNENALELARWLENQPAVGRVFYPGLDSHPQHELARTQMHGFGGMLSFEVAGGLTELQRFIDGLKLIPILASLGGVETSVIVPTVSSHYAMGVAGRAELGIADTLVRLSVGIEDVADLKADLQTALDATGRSGS